MGGSRKRRYSLYDDTVVAEDQPQGKTPRHSPQHMSVRPGPRAEASPARSISSSIAVAKKGLSSAANWLSSRLSGSISRSSQKTLKDKETQHSLLLNGDASSTDGLANGGVESPPMRQIGQKYDRPLMDSFQSTSQLGSNGDPGPSTRSRTRSRSPNPQTPKVQARQALMSASPPDSEQLAVPTSTLPPSHPASQLTGSTHPLSTLSTEPPSTFLTLPEPGRSTTLDVPDPAWPTQSTALATQPTLPTQLIPSPSSPAPPAESMDEPTPSRGSTSPSPSHEDFADAAEGTEDQPIELGNSDEEEELIEAGPSRRIQPAVSHTTRRAPPTRPELKGLNRPREYHWVGPPHHTAPVVRSTASPVTRSRARTSTPQRRYRTQNAAGKERNVTASKLEAMAKEVGGKVGNATRRVARSFRMQTGGGFRETVGAKLEKTFKRESVLYKDPTRTKAILGRMLLGDKTADEVILPQPEPVYDVNRSRRIANRAAQEAATHPRVSIDDLRERLQRQRLEEEAEIQKRLHPKAPTKMSDARAKQVRAHLANSAFKVEHLDAEVRAASLARLRDGAWLDDEVINYYGSMIQARSDRVHKSQNAAEANGDVGKDIPNIHYFNSFFYKKLSEDGYAGSRLKRWTKKFDLFAKDLVIFPINLGNMHWTVGAINLRERRVEYYDSMSEYTGKGEAIFRELFEYLRAEHQDKKGSPFDDSEWTSQYSIKTPQQNNGSDCGVFSCQTLDALSRGKDLSDVENFDFGCENMEYFRKLMVLEIAEGKLEPRWPKET